MVGHESGSGRLRVRPLLHSAGSLNAEPKSAMRQGSGTNFLSTKAPASVLSEKTLAEIRPPSSRADLDLADPRRPSGTAQRGGEVARVHLPIDCRKTGDEPVSSMDCRAPFFEVGAVCSSAFIVCSSPCERRAA